MKAEFELLAELKKESDLTSVEGFERELAIASRLCSLEASSDRVNAFGFLVDQFNSSKFDHTSSTQARLFEYAALTGSFDIGNAQLNNLASHSELN